MRNLSLIQSDKEYKWNNSVIRRKEFYDFINYAYEQCEGSEFVSGMAELKTAAKRLKYGRQAGFEFEKDDLMFIDDQDVMHKSMVVYRWFNGTKSARKELF